MAPSMPDVKIFPVAQKTLQEQRRQCIVMDSKVVGPSGRSWDRTSWPASAAACVHYQYKAWVRCLATVGNRT